MPRPEALYAVTGFTPELGIPAHPIPALATIPEDVSYFRQSLLANEPFNSPTVLEVPFTPNL
jgi:hypothetical protein